MYKGTLKIVNIVARNENEALEMFWNIVHEDGKSLEVIIERED